MRSTMIFGALTLALTAAQFAQAATEKVLFHTMRGEPPQLNSMKATDVESNFVLGHVMEGLTRYTQKPDGSVEAGVAEKWEVTEKSAVFHLRKNAKWSDGKPVTAKDFIFAWQTTLKPETASEYAFIMYPMKNAEAINQGKMPASALGAKAVDDYTIEITFEKPTGYFLSLSAFATYYPVREDFYNAQAGKYGANMENMLYNGAFTLTKWTHGASIEFTKNPNYWNQKLTKLDKVEIPYITPDNSAKYNLFKDKKVDVLTPLGKDDLPKAQKDGFKVLAFPDSTIWYLEFNMRKGRPTTNLNLRKAIQMAFADRQEYISKIIGIPGTRPGTTLIPSTIKGVSLPFNKEFPYSPPKPNDAEAKKLVEKAKAELGGKLPTLTILVDDTPLADREGQFFQNLIKTKLGIEVKLDKQIFKQRLAKMTSGDFDIVNAGWGPDYPDPLSFADVKASWNENNRGHWENADYDRLIREAMATTDQKKRMAAFGASQKILLDDVGILPTYERVQAWTQNERVSGVVRRTFGPDPDFTHAVLK